MVCVAIIVGDSIINVAIKIIQQLHCQCRHYHQQFECQYLQYNQQFNCRSVGVAITLGSLFCVNIFMSKVSVGVIMSICMIIFVAIAMVAAG